MIFRTSHHPYRWFVLLLCLPALLAAEPAAAPAPPLSLSVLKQLEERLLSAGQPPAKTDAPAATQPAAPKAEAPTTETSAATEPAEEPPSVLVTAADRVEMHVSDTPLPVVLRMLANQSRRNFIASPKVGGNVTADLFNVTFRQALESILLPNDCGFIERDGFVYVHTLEELAEKTSAARAETLTAKLFNLHYVAIKDVKPIIEPLLSKEGRIATTPDAETGLETSPQKAGGNQLSGPDTMIVYDYPSRLKEVERIIRELDVRPCQVLVEATILQAQLGENNALGIDFNLVGGVDFEKLGSTSTGITNLTTGYLPTETLNKTTFTTQTDFRGAVPRGGMTFGIIKDNFAVFLRALEQISETTVLANPKVLTLNKQRGVVIVGRRDGYMTTIVTETTATQTVEYLETGTQLVFRPFVGDEGYIRMEIHPEDSTGGLNEVNLPFKRTTEVTTNIMVRDGQTILIGGLFRESSEITRGQIPVLGNIPVAGALFRNNSDTTGREEVIILLTVRIIKDESYAQAGAELAEDVKRIHVGIRRGLQFYGRNRLSQLHYRSALEHLEAGREKRALWDTCLALHLDSTYHPALKMKEQLLGRDVEQDEATAIRDFISHRLNEEAAKPAAGAEQTK